MNDWAKMRVYTPRALPYSDGGDKRMDPSLVAIRITIQIAIAAVILLSVIGSLAGAMLLLRNDRRRQD